MSTKVSKADAAKRVGIKTDDVLSFRQYGDDVVVVTTEGQKLRASEVETADAGNNDGPKALEDHTVKELEPIAEALGIEGFTSLKKAELIEAIEKARADAENGAGDE